MYFQILVDLIYSFWPFRSQTKILSLKSFRTQDPKTYTTLYKTYVRPIIEYNTSIWSPNLISDIKRIESIQAKFTRTLFQKLNTNYRDYQYQLELLDLESLESRRLKNDLTLVYKFQNNVINLNMEKFFTKSTLNTKYRRNLLEVVT